MDYKEKYEQALENLKKIKAANKDNKELMDFIEYQYPELKESEDEKARKGLIDFLKSPFVAENITDEKVAPWIAWLEKQGEQANPYSGISFEYNDHTWGMCARDGGVDICLDKQLFTHLEKQKEQKPTWSEEDEDYYDAIIAKLEVTQFDALLTDNQMEFLKSLKSRMKGE